MVLRPEGKVCILASGRNCLFGLRQETLDGGRYSGGCGGCGSICAMNRGGRGAEMLVLGVRVCEAFEVPFPCFSA